MIFFLLFSHDQITDLTKVLQFYIIYKNFDYKLYIFLSNNGYQFENAVFILHKISKYKICMRL